MLINHTFFDPFEKNLQDEKLKTKKITLNSRIKNKVSAKITTKLDLNKKKDLR